MKNMAAWVPKIVQTTKNQNVRAISFAVQSRDYCTKPRIIKNPTTASLKRGTGGRSSFNGIVCTIFGCSGFIGKSLGTRLGKIGTQLILPHRCDPYHVRELKVGGDLGQVLFHPFHLEDEESIIRSIKYSNVVINLVGANYETSNFTYRDVHVEGARRLARLAKQCNVERFIHVSCLNASDRPTPMILNHGSNILKTKWLGEQAVREEFPEATIVRPSVIYGPGDKFVNHYLTRKRQIYQMCVPLWRRGEATEKQPVHISDVVSGIVAIVRNPQTAGQTYQFIGPMRYKLRDLVEWLYQMALKNGEDAKVYVVDMRYHPFAWLKTTFFEYLYMVHAAYDLSWEVLEYHHVSDKVDYTLPTLEDLGITPAKMEDAVISAVQPLERFRYAVNKLQRMTPITLKTVQK